MKIRNCEASDAKNICHLYNHHIKNTVVTFEEKEVTENEISARIILYTKNHPWLVIETDHQDFVGYAYASEWSNRTAFRKSVETTIYIDPLYAKKGYGKALYKALLSKLLHSEYHTALAAIALPNEASVKIHEQFGFRKVGHFNEVGYKFNKWVDVGYWQLDLESLSNP